MPNGLSVVRIAIRYLGYLSQVHTTTEVKLIRQSPRKGGRERTMYIAPRVEWIAIHHQCGHIIHSSIVEEMSSYTLIVSGMGSDPSDPSLEPAVEQYHVNRNIPVRGVVSCKMRQLSPLNRFDLYRRSEESDCRYRGFLPLSSFECGGSWVATHLCRTPR